MAIRKGYGCKTKPAAPVPVEEVFQGKTVWKGTVEVFDLIGRPSAKLAYVWGHAERDTGNEVRVVTALGLPPVDSPRKAVPVSIVNEVRSKA